MREGIFYECRSRKGAAFFMEDTKEKDALCFKYEAERYLHTLGIEALRGYGRHLQLEAPTKMRKGALIAEILKVLCKERFPQRNKKGAPVKNQHLDAQILETVSELKNKYLFDETDNSPQESFLEKNDTENSLQNTVLQFTVIPALLNERQKSLLNDFLNSL